MTENDDRASSNTQWTYLVMTAFTHQKTELMFYAYFRWKDFASPYTLIDKWRRRVAKHDYRHISDVELVVIAGVYVNTVEGWWLFFVQ